MERYACGSVPASRNLDRRRSDSLGLDTDYPDPADYLIFTPDQLVALRVGWTKGSDPAVEKLAAHAIAATAPAVRRSRYQQIQQGLNARSPFIPLIQAAQAFVTTTDLANAAFSSAYEVDATQISPK